MAKHKELQIQQMNQERAGKILITMTKDSRFTKHYQEMIESRGRVFKALPLIATRRAYVDPGCSASLYHEIGNLRSEYNVDTSLISGTWKEYFPMEHTPLWIMPNKGHLIEDGLLVENCPYTGGQVATSIFNMSNEQKKIKEGEVYSILYWMPDSLVEWEIV